MNNEVETRIPIYRAKKIDSDEYIEGCLTEKQVVWITETTNYKMIYFITRDAFKQDRYEIDPSTLAIHFPDMIEDGTKIFASLRVDGKGGDIFKYAGQRIGTCIYNKQSIMVGIVPIETVFMLSKDMKVIGIQE